MTWKEPEEKNGVISGYQVKWTDWNGEKKFKSTDGNTFSLQIVEPSCGGKVDVTVRAKTTDVEEFGEESPPRSVFFGNSGKCIHQTHQRSRVVEILLQRHTVINIKARNLKDRLILCILLSMLLSDKSHLLLSLEFEV